MRRLPREHSARPAALRAAEEAGLAPQPDATLTTGRAAMKRVADADVVPELAAMPPGTTPLRHAIVGQRADRPGLLAMRRLAQQSACAQRLADTT